jgi:hypothetical protein
LKYWIADILMVEYQSFVSESNRIRNEMDQIHIDFDNDLSCLHSQNLQRR